MALDDDQWVAKFVESFSSVLSSETQLGKEFVGEGCALVPVYPYGQGGAGGVVISRFADRAKCPVDPEGPKPSVRDPL